MGLYGANTFKTVLDDGGRSWRDDFARMPELVAVWDRFHLFTGNREARASLHAPAQDAQRIVQRPSGFSMTPDEAIEALDKCRFVARILAEPYTILICTTYSPKSQATTTVPIVLRQFDNAYRVTDELPLSALVHYLGSLAPGAMVDITGVRKVSPSEIAGLEAFEEIIELPRPGQKHATTTLVPRPDRATLTSDGNKVLFYCRPQVEPDLGYGMAVSALATSTWPETPIKQISRLLLDMHRSSSLDAIESFWHSRDHEMIRKRMEASRSREANARPDAGRLMPLSIPIKESARALVSIPTDLGTVGYFLNAKEDLSRPGGFARIALVEQAGKKVLASGLKVDSQRVSRAGLIDGLLETTEFKKGLGEFLRQRAPAFVRQLQSE
jgi:hypothetical protein